MEGPCSRTRALDRLSFEYRNVDIGVDGRMIGGRGIRWAIAPACVVIVSAVIVACRGVTNAELRDDGRCPQTYEFGNFGCARVVALVRAPTEPLPTRLRIEVSLYPIRADAGWAGSIAMDSSVRAARVDATLMFRPLPSGVDTASAWVVAHVRDPSAPSMPVLASDSVRHVLRFVPVGAIAIVDTVSLQLRRP